jgi:hypothetical protein
MVGPTLIEESDKPVGAPSISRVSRGARGIASLAFSRAAGASGFMVVSYASVNGSYSASGNVRFPVGRLKVGPEFTVTGNRNYRQVRVGPGVAGLSVGGVQFGLSAGGTFKDDGSSAAFLGMTGYRDF